jgi:Transglutaminase-like superfamily
MLLEAAAALLIVRVGLWTLPFATLTRIVDWVANPIERQRSAVEAGRIGRTVTAVARRLPLGMTCLVEALAAQAMLRRRGYVSTLRFGVRSGKNPRTIDAHAWLECDGLVVVGAIDALQEYAPMNAADADAGVITREPARAQPPEPRRLR